MGESDKFSDWLDSIGRFLLVRDGVIWIYSIGGASMTGLWMALQKFPWYYYVPASVGVAWAFSIAISVFKGESREANIAPSKPHSQSKSEVRGSGNSSNNFAPQFTLNLGDLRQPIELSVPAIIHKKEREPRIGLTFGPLMYKDLTLDNGDIWRFSDGPRRVVPGLVLPIYFDPGASDGVYSIEYVIAHVRFTAANLAPIIIDRAVWINSIYDNVELHPGMQKYIIILTLSRSGGLPLSLKNNRSGPGWQIEHPDAIEIVPIPLEANRLEVIVMWGGGSQYKRTEVFPINLPELIKLYPPSL